jgi:hypothetical protein
MRIQMYIQKFDKRCVAIFTVLITVILVRWFTGIDRNLARWAAGDLVDSLTYAGITFCLGLVVFLCGINNLRVRILGTFIGVVAAWWFIWVVINYLAADVHGEYPLVHWPPGNISIACIIIWMIASSIIGARVVSAVGDVVNAQNIFQDNPDLGHP